MTPAQVEAYVQASAVALGLPLSPEYRPGVVRFFSIAAEFAAIVDAVPLDTHAESAVHFTPVPPRDARDLREAQA